jgi:hypothetical protein
MWLTEPNPSTLTLKRQDKDQALQQAMIHAQQDSRWTYPYYWEPLSC